jgi:hypothetical protein
MSAQAARPAAKCPLPVRTASYFFEQARPWGEEPDESLLCRMDFSARKFFIGGFSPWLPHLPTSKDKRSPGKTA